MYGGGLFLIAIVFMGISLLVGWVLKRRFESYSKVPTSSGLTGAEVADKMLRDNNIHDVTIQSVQGKLTDHYDPRNKTINLSADVYAGRHVAAAAVAAHETGHAIQHATAYSFLEFRSALVPAASFASKMMHYVFMFALFGGLAMSWFSSDLMLWILIIGQSAITAFTLVTLPVEIDASNRALVWLNSAGIAQGGEYAKAKDALKWAAYTYVVAALAAVAQLLYLILALVGRRD